ncbi:hypothetical protein ACHAXT_007263 [Thalassiosira profunda]
MKILLAGALLVPLVPLTLGDEVVAAVSEPDIFPSLDQPLEYQVSRYRLHAGDGRRRVKQQRKKKDSDAVRAGHERKRKRKHTKDRTNKKENDSQSLVAIAEERVEALYAGRTSQTRTYPNNNGGRLRVSSVYTYGAPSIARDPAASNPNNRCLPGLRIYTEDASLPSCSWWQFWCTAGKEREVTNVDFASKVNVEEGYPHPKMAALVLRLVDGETVEYTYKPCRNAEDVDQYGYQWWPEAELPASILPQWSIHGLDEHYERRLQSVPRSVRGPSLEYVSAARCSYKSSEQEIRACLNDYEQETSSQLGGVAVLGWEMAAHMVHETNGAIVSDTDTVYVLKNDRPNGTRRCIITFQGSDGTADLSNFVFGSNDATEYCGRPGMHSGVAGELRGITQNPQYAKKIVPVLETCHEVTCVGHSLGGALCNVFAMCANSDPGNSNRRADRNGNEDFEALTWKAR